MTVKIGLQLYSIRNELSENFDDNIRQMADWGYQGVELAGLYGQKPSQVSQILSDVNLDIVAMHCDVLTTDGLKRSLDDAEALNCKNLICPWTKPDTFKSEKEIRLFADKLNEANQQINNAGKKLLYHNHDFEFQLINGESSFELFVAQLDPSICLELDLYLAAIGGAQPIELLQKYAHRTTMLHIKDGSISPPTPNTAIGDGTMNYSAIFEWITQDIEWFFVEIEDCATDVLEAVRKSVGSCEKLIYERIKSAHTHQIR